MCEPYLKISVSFHLPFVEFGQNTPDELIRVARAMSINKLGMDGERRDIHAPLNILPIVIPCNFIEYVTDGKLLRAADQEDHFLEDIAVNGHDIDEKGSVRGSEERRTKRTSSVTRCDEMYHSWAGIGPYVAT